MQRKDAQGAHTKRLDIQTHTNGPERQRGWSDRIDGY